MTNFRLLRNATRSRRLEEFFRNRNPLGVIITLECPRCYETPKGIPFGGGCIDGADLGKGTSTLMTPLKWPSKVLAIDDSGPVCEEAFCPECGSKGRREIITPLDFDGMFTAEQLAEISQGRIHTLLFLMQQMINPEDPRPAAQLKPQLKHEWIAQKTAQRLAAVVDHIYMLIKLGWISCWAPSLVQGVTNVSPDGGSVFIFGRQWGPFFAGIEQSIGTQVRQAPQRIIAEDCKHESPYKVKYADAVQFLPEQLSDRDIEAIANGTITLIKPLLCPECQAREDAR